MRIIFKLIIIIFFVEQICLGLFGQLYSQVYETRKNDATYYYKEDSNLSFTDITLSSGISDSLTDEHVGAHSATFTDVDNDGLPDLYVTNWFSDMLLDNLFFHNKGNGEFFEEAMQRGLKFLNGGSHGACFADFDNDGDYDLFNGTTFDSYINPTQNSIFENDGAGNFSDVSVESGISLNKLPTRGVVAFDIEGDGDLDVFCVSNYLGSNDPPDEHNELYRNEGNFKFTNITTGAPYTAPAGQGVTATDFDGDGDIDIIAGNRTGPLNILQNDGQGNFKLIHPDSIGIFHQGLEGVTMGDVDNDGDLDMAFPGNPNGDIGYLYLNNGNGTFTYNRSFLNIDGYMAGFADLDNDSDLDMVFAGDPVCYLNDGAGNFIEGPEIPVAGINDPRAIGFADIDDDGDQDFLISCKRSQSLLIRNDLNSGNWLKVKLITEKGQVGAYGAKLYIYPPGQDRNTIIGMREARSSNGYLGQDEPVIHFGLGSYSFVDIKVQFNEKTCKLFENVSANQTITVQPDEEVTIPSIPAGSDSGIIGENYNFITGRAYSNYGNDVEYQFDWADGTMSNWGNGSRDHVYFLSGVYSIKARARCVLNNNVVSEWSDAYNIVIRGFQLSVVIDPAGSGSVVKYPDKYQYAMNDKVNLKASNATDYTFDRWSGSLSGSDISENIVMDSDKNVIAHFKKNLEVVSVPEKLILQTHGFKGELLIFAVSGAESNLGHKLEYQFNWGDGNYSYWGDSLRSHTYFIEDNYTVSARARCKSHNYVISNWSDSINVVITGCHITEVVDPEASGQIIKFPEKNDYYYGEEVTLSIDVKPGYNFIHWNQDFDDTTLTKKLILKNDTSIVAFFELASGIESRSENFPTTFGLNQNYPNPFNSETTIQYKLPENCNVNISIFNLEGQLIKVLLENEYHDAGFFTTIWNGTDKTGNVIPSALYLYRIKTEKYSKTKKMFLIK